MLTNLDRKDLYWIIRRLPPPLREMMKRQRRGLVVAGGFVRACVAGERAADIDVFVSSKDAALALSTELAKGGRLIKTDNAYTVADRFALSVQFIHRWVYSSPEELLESFDFTIARSALWFNGPTLSDWESLCDPRFYPDLAAKRLVYCSPQRNEDAGGSLLRVLKFYQRGYRIPLDSLGAVTARLLCGIDESLLGVAGTREERLSAALTGLLHEVDPLADPEHLAHLPATTEALDTILLED